MPILDNARHERFAQAVAKGQTVDEAYVTAGFKANRGNAARLNANESVVKRIAELLERGAARTEVTIARTLEEFAKIGFADIRGIFAPGGGLLNPAEMTDGMAACVQAVEVIVRRVPGDEKHVEEVHKIKLNDKLGALNSIARHLGMFIDKSEVEHKGGIEIVDSPRERLASRIAVLASRASAPSDPGGTDGEGSGGS